MSATHRCRTTLRVHLETNLLRWSGSVGPRSRTQQPLSNDYVYTLLTMKQGWMRLALKSSRIYLSYVYTSSRSRIGSSLPTAGEKVCIPVLTWTLNPAVLEYTYFYDLRPPIFLFNLKYVYVVRGAIIGHLGAKNATLLLEFDTLAVRVERSSIYQWKALKEKHL